MSPPELESRDELLTAYLDGELSSDESSRVEAQLVVDEPMRLRLAELRKTYDLLDEVPETPYNQSFTRSTVELVVQEISNSKVAIEPVTDFRSSESGATYAKISWWNWPKLGWLLAGFLLSGFLIGLGTKLFWQRIEIRQLGLAADVPGLIDVHDLSIAERIAKEKTALEVLKNHFGEDVLPPVPLSLSKRKQWVDSLTARQLDRVVRGREILKKQAPEVNNRLSALESVVESHSNSDSLQDAIRIVGLVFDDLPSYKRQDLDSLNQEKRYQFIRDSLLFEAAQVYSQQISSTDVKALQDWYSSVLVPSVNSQFGDVIDSRQASWVLLRNLTEDPNFYLQNHDEILPSLLENLSPTARELLVPLSKSDQTRVFGIWVRPTGDMQQRFVDEYERNSQDYRERRDLMDPVFVRRFGPGRRR